MNHHEMIEYYCTVNKVFGFCIAVQGKQIKIVRQDYIIAHSGAASEICESVERRCNNVM